MTYWVKGQRNSMQMETIFIFGNSLGDILCLLPLDQEYLEKVTSFQRFFRSVISENMSLVKKHSQRSFIVSVAKFCELLFLTLPVKL
jgi:hypothetical protein